MKKIGVLGGGQLGLMLWESLSDERISLSFLDPDPDCSCARIGADCVVGDFRDEAVVQAFSSDKDILTVEIEHVSIEGLRAAAAAGVQVYPQADILEMIQDKGAQKQFYAQHDIPTAPFELLGTSAELDIEKWPLPVVLKSRKGGYDGKGVKVVKDTAEISGAFPQPCLVEILADIRKELSVIVARNPDGQTTTFPVVEMEFDPAANLVSALISPADIPEEVEREAERISTSLMESMGLVGILAVELFWLNDGGIWVNEVAPRPHNSGHQTIEGNETSQYEQHLKAISNEPLGSTDAKGVSVMVNLLGREGHEGPKRILGLEALENRENVFVHDYAKAITRPYRKMGHATVIGTDRVKVLAEALSIQDLIRYESD